MRTLFLFALTAVATVALTADASAIGKRKKKGNDCSSCSAPVAVSSCSSGGCGVSGYHTAYDGTTSGRSVVTATDGKTYVLGSDGSYYASDSVQTLGGFATQPYYGRTMNGPYPGTYSTYPGTYTYPGMYRGTGYPGVGPAGYTSGYYDPRVTPAGYTAPLTMPGINIGAGGITVTPMLMPRR